MATLRTKKLVLASDKTWTVEDEYRGRITVFTEVPVKMAGDRGEDELVLRTFSQKLLEKMKPGDEIHGYSFPGKDCENHPEAWRFSVKAKDNEHITGGWDGGGAQQAPSGTPQGTDTGHEAPKADQWKGYTLEALVALMKACVEEYDDVRLAAALFTAAVSHGITAGGQVDEDGRAKLVEEIVAVAEQAGLDISEVTDTLLISVWEEAGGNEASFGIKMAAELAGNAAGPGDGAGTEPADDHDKLPF